MKKLLPLFIIPFLSFGQCEDTTACNYGLVMYDNNEPIEYPNNDCEYLGDACLAPSPFYLNQAWVSPSDAGWYNDNLFAWDENCNCTIYPGCQDENACNYDLYCEDNILWADDNNSSLDGYYSPECLLPGDNCLLLDFFGSADPFCNDELGTNWSVNNSMSQLYGVLNENCQCLCDEDLLPFEYFSNDGLGGATLVTINDCSQIGCSDPFACNYSPDAIIEIDCDYESCSCQDENACNYNLTSEYFESLGGLPYPYLACEYAGDGCLTDGPNGWYSLQYIWNDDCECAPAEGCLDSSACNYGQSFDGFVISAFGEPFQYGGYESPPYCLSPGDSCNVFYENSVIPAPIPMNLLPPYDYFTYYGFYSGIFNSNCECICTNPEYIYSYGNVPYFDECPQFGCTDSSACNYSVDAEFDDGSCYYPDLCGNCDSSDECGCSELTYVPDDSFENYIETNFPQASNGVVNDNYVLTSGIDFSDEFSTYISFNDANLDYPIFDLTGIENFKGVYNMNIGGPGILISNLDLSCLQLKNGWSQNQVASLSITNSNFLENVILPTDTFSLNISGNDNLVNVEFQPEAYYSNISIGTDMISFSDNESLCYLNIKGNALNNSFNLSVNEGYLPDDYNNNGTNIDLLEFNSVYGISAVFYDYDNSIYPSNWQVRFNDDIYDWTSVAFNWLAFNENNFVCIDVVDPDYADLYWGPADYSTGCWDPSNLDCASFISMDESAHEGVKKLIKIFDVLGRSSKNNGLQLRIYDDGTVEKSYIIK